MIVTHTKRKNDTYDKQMQWVFDGLLFFTWLWIPMLIIFAVLTALEVGHIPFYANPDPKDMVFANFFIPFIIFSLVGSFVTFPLWLMMAVFGLAGKINLRYVWLRISFFVLCMVILGSMVRAYGLLDWFMD